MKIKIDSPDTLRVMLCFHISSTALRCSKFQKKFYDIKLNYIVSEEFLAAFYGLLIGCNTCPKHF